MVQTAFSLFPLKQNTHDYNMIHNMDSNTYFAKFSKQIKLCYQEMEFFIYCCILKDLI